MKRYYYFKLSDPRNPDVVRYVGSTTENLSVRLSKMVSEAIKTDRQTPVFEWVRELFNIDKKPFIDLLEISELISETDANNRQLEIIESFQANGLADLNLTKGRGTKGYNKPQDEETKKKISDKNVGRKMSKEFCDKRSELTSGKNNPRYGVKLSDDHIALLAEARAKAPKYECIHCKQMFMKQYITRYHNDNCKMKENN